MNNLSFAEYLWIDGAQPTQQIRSKARIVNLPDQPQPSDFPAWSFDGSSTNQAEGHDSDCILNPVRVYQDPFRGAGNYLVLCEVNDAQNRTHSSNQRARLRKVLDDASGLLDPWLGFEQEYTLFRDGRPLGFPAQGFPAPQGQYYCAAGNANVFGRDVVEAHAQACLAAGILFYGINAEVMPGQWEFQIGYRGISGEKCDALTVADDVWVARYLLNRVGEVFGVDVSLDNKPMKGDWNGAGMHTNFSTSDTRDPRYGLAAINSIVSALEAKHSEHIVEYGDRLAERLTGLHETCSINTFKSGIAHRGASIRIPQPVAQQGYGYLEDRRPGANSDPYRVGVCLIAAVDCARTGQNRA
ncbi:MAG: glutamine synthetase beta-grasp domain-containing protein [Gammaproteobacteria bacterium]|nr:glutamine synthetase beta-grasp domain-containing protein [Gammaproteobacteria bacterium]MBU2056654.1 glutamine synthetase beta-grasp domain-containing protein [Gammaproteobacteria bacterium]MBU2173991.1 glutamine synthetase beta-grasp domain-containing protein [Gammaproteobacteria bacterium]MBU2247297.1 glutamine synthetase beta-grasp domain-containing protein [Gammaproteobacteria bacterium]MBU2346045.1 glutamine synthetase beta-grasp domain-containing protein [Gammaproteobacteria bacterium